MNKSKLHSITSNLPYALEERVNGYVDSIIISMDSIFESAGIKFNEELANKIILIAGIKKLFDIINAAYWTLDNTATVLERNGTSSIRIGATSYSKGSKYYSDLFIMQDELKQILIDANIYDYVDYQSYSDIVKSLSVEP